jgi:Fungal Zn(2)-Cys(6) binuclear cluster domain
MYEKPETVSEPAYKSASSHIKPIPAAPGPPHGLNQRSCGTCRRRKVKCDKREGGCSNCTRSNIECFYPGPGRAPRRTKTGKRVNERETELLKRLRRLEGVVEELSGQVELEGVRTSPTSLKEPKDLNCVNGTDSTGWSKSTVRVVGIDEDCAPLKTDTIISELGKLVIDEGKSRYVGNAFWAKLSGEMDNMREMLEESDAPSEDDEEDNSPNASMSPDFGDHQSFIMGYATSNVDLRSLHPLPSQIPFYWETFATNVDPICKV